MNELLMKSVAQVNMLFMQKMPLAINNAFTSTSDTMSNLVKWAGTIAGAFIALFLIYAIAKDAFEYIKGQGSGSMFKIITKVIFLLFCIGLIVVAQNYASWQDSAAGIANSALGTVGNIANELIP